MKNSHIFIISIILALALKYLGIWDEIGNFVQYSYIYEKYKYQIWIGWALFMIIAVVTAIVNATSKACDVAGEALSVGAEAVKDVWKTTNMNDRILNGIGSTIETVRDVYEGFIKLLTKENIQEWLYTHNYTQESIIVIEKETISVKEYIVTCKVYDNANNVRGYAHWKCQEIDYELERIIGRSSVKSIVNFK